MGGNKNMGFDIESEAAEIKDCLESNILDLMIAKKWALKYATNAAATVLRVDHHHGQEGGRAQAPGHDRWHGPGRRLDADRYSHSFILFLLNILMYSYSHF